MNVDGKLVAIVGPNESGKSSFLRALERLNENDSSIVTEGSQELTRGASIPNNQTVINARFLLNDGDREAIKHLPGADKARWVDVSKKARDEGLYCSVDPPPSRNLQPREAIVRSLRKALSRKGFRDLDADQEELGLADSVEDLASKLDTEQETLSEETVEAIQALAELLQNALSDGELKYLWQLTKQLHELAEREKGNPHASAKVILARRRPKFLLFSDAARSLRSEYRLDEILNDPPTALVNLARIADLDLEALHETVTNNDPAQRARIVELANRKLESTFTSAWTQSDLTVSFMVEGLILRVQMREPKGAYYTSIDERSDGLRQFVALLAFAKLEDARQTPILLIDEAETHLHYDAQADLIQVLTRQDVVSKVVYTTHSIGCLPEDLGTGVRLVEVDKSDSHASSIQNWFWQSRRPGFSPLLFGMGASTLAFIPVRYAVITEGISDIILWPTLFREATNSSYLGFQIVPGLSEATRPEIIELDHEAPSTAYLVDSDRGGDKLCKKLTDEGISKDRIFRIPTSGKQKLAVEDLVGREIYFAAVNEELSRSNGIGVSFPNGKMPAEGRSNAVESWCKDKGIDPPSKRAVAYHILELGSDSSILTKRYRSPLQKLYSDIASKLQKQVSST